MKRKPDILIILSDYQSSGEFKGYKKLDVLEWTKAKDGSGYVYDHIYTTISKKSSFGKDCVMQMVKLYAVKKKYCILYLP